MYDVRFDEALHLYHKAISIKEKQFGKSHISVAVVLNNIASVYQIQGQHRKALRLYEVCVGVCVYVCVYVCVCVLYIYIYMFVCFHYHCV